MNIQFPLDFLFGTATSAAQIEGAADTDGRTPSIWDTFAAHQGTIADSSTPHNACDFYHRYADDFRLAKKMHLDSFRFSFSWSRIFPDGTGKVNPAGVDYYRRMIDALHENNLVPNATLYHWDLPQALQDRGGWLNRDIVNWFGDYAQTLFQLFGDSVPLWSTFNEPIAVYVGHADGIFAPGGRSEADGRQANHHLLLAHGNGVQRFRAECHSGQKIGVVVDIWHHHPLRPEHPRDCAMAELANERTYRSYLHPLLLGRYSDFLLDNMQQNHCMPHMKSGDMEMICQPLDFFGLNCYNRVVDCADPQYAEHLKAQEKGGNYQDDGGFYPKAIYDALMILKNDYHLSIPVYITENGTCGRMEQIAPDSQIHDHDRIRYIKGFLYWLHRAMAEGMDVRGYYAWSLLDNWEWIAGYAARFGLVHVNYETQERIVKDSGKWYAKLAESHILSVEEEFL